MGNRPPTAAMERHPRNGRVDKETRGISKRLDCMSDIDSDLPSKGTCDRWRRVFDILKDAGNNPLKKDDVIEVHCATELVSPLVLQVLYLLKDNVKYCHYKNNDKTLEALPTNLSECKCDIKVFEFPDRNNAYLWLACQKGVSEKSGGCQPEQQNAGQCSLFCEPAGNSVFHSGRESGIIQLFKLGFSLFERPINVNNLLSYLQLTTHPIRGKLRSELARHLQSEGGRGEKWDAIIKNFDFTVKKEKNGKIATKDLRDEKMEFLKPLEGDYETGIPRKDVLSFSNALSDWAKKEPSPTKSLKRKFLS